MTEMQRPDAEPKDKTALLASLKHALGIADHAGFALAAIHIQNAIDILEEAEVDARVRTS